jgi:hypothetical protein
MNSQILSQLNEIYRKGVYNQETLSEETSHEEELTNIEESSDLYDIVSNYLVSEGFCDSPEAADVIMANMSEEWRESILEEIKKK